MNYQNMNRVGVVISRYYESLKWIEELTSNIDVYVYDRIGESPGMGVPDAVSWSHPKDPKDNLGGLNIQKCKENGITLEVINIPDDPGFEASTYIYHLYSKYNSLNDFTVCIQGHPQMYIKDVINILNNPEDLIHTTNLEGSSEDFAPVVRTLIESEIQFEPFCDHFARLYPNSEYQWSIYKSDFSKMPWFEYVKNMPGAITDVNGRWIPPNSWRFGAGNQFIVRKDLVHKKDIEFYKTLHQFVNTYLDPNGDARPNWQQLNQGPNIMEGTWGFIFK